MGTNPRPQQKDDGALPLSDSEFAPWLQARVLKRSPAAIVRFGDLEAWLLTGVPEDPEATEAVLGQLERQAGLTPTPRELIQIRALLEEAFERADVLGILPERRLEQHVRLMGKLTALHAARVTEGRPPVPLASNMLSHRVLDELPHILAGRQVSIIACRDLRPPLEGEWGLDNVAVYQVPSQHDVRDVDGPYEAAMRDMPIWPDTHARLRAELTVRERGEVFLVGAGVFGKDLCIRVRERGGIALDMGSALDSLAGKVTRGPERRAFELYAQGFTVNEIASRLEGIFGVPVESDKVTAAIAQAALGEVAPWRRRPLQPTYAAAWFHTLRVVVGEGERKRRRTCRIALGMAPDGYRERLGIWWRDEEDAWREVLEDLSRRGVRLLQSIRGATIEQPLAEAAREVFPCAETEAGHAPPGSFAVIDATVERHGEFRDEEAAAALVYFSFGRAEARC